MIEGKTVLAVITARGGSKGIPGKNIRLLANRPLIAWTIEEAKKSSFIDRTILSTDDAGIMSIGRSWGCEVPFVRPAHLAQDDTPSFDVIAHAIQEVDPKYDYIVLLQPTSPLRSVEDIDGCIESCVKNKAVACVTVTEAETSPYWMYLLDESNHMQPVLELDKKINRRQDLPLVYALNGAVYISETRRLIENKSFLTRDTIAYPMPAERSIDIDTEVDFQLCEWFLSKHNLKPF